MSSAAARPARSAGTPAFAAVVTATKTAPSPGSKDGLLRELSRGGLNTILEAIEEVTSDERDPWTMFSDFMIRLVDADVAALTLSLAGKFTPTEDMWELAARRNADRERTKQLRRRYLAVILDGLRGDRNEPLPGPPPTDDEINERWRA